MTNNISRRKAIFTTAAVAGAAVLVGTPGIASASPANVPVIWDGKKMYEIFAEKATGLSYPGPAGRPKAYVAFDPQCPDCMRLMERARKLYDKVDVVWCPIAFLNIHSEPQGAAILAAAEPWKKLDEQHEHFRDAFRGIRYELGAIPVELREKVWVNTKLHRRAGCRAVPFGVFKNAKGEYLPFDENLTTAELAALFGVEPPAE